MGILAGEWSRWNLQIKLPLSCFCFVQKANATWRLDREWLENFWKISFGTFTRSFDGSILYADKAVQDAVQRITRNQRTLSSANQNMTNLLLLQLLLSSPRLRTPLLQKLRHQYSPFLLPARMNPTGSLRFLGDIHYLLYPEAFPRAPNRVHDHNSFLLLYPPFLLLYHLLLYHRPHHHPLFHHFCPSTGMNPTGSLRHLGAPRKPHKSKFLRRNSRNICSRSTDPSIQTRPDGPCFVLMTELSRTTNRGVFHPKGFGLTEDQGFPTGLPTGSSRGVSPWNASHKTV